MALAAMLKELVSVSAPAPTRAAPGTYAKAGNVALLCARSRQPENFARSVCAAFAIKSGTNQRLVSGINGSWLPQSTSSSERSARV